MQHYTAQTTTCIHSPSQANEPGFQCQGAQQCVGADSAQAMESIYRMGFSSMETNDHVLRNTLIMVVLILLNKLGHVFMVYIIRDRADHHPTQIILQTFRNGTSHVPSQSLLYTGGVRCITQKHVARVTKSGEFLA